MKLLSTILGLCLILGSIVPVVAGEGGATYQRNRMKAGRGQRGGGGFYNQPYYGYGGFFVPPIVVGSYYQRPYPTHLDFFRLRQRNYDFAPRTTCPHCEMPITPVPVE